MYCEVLIFQYSQYKYHLDPEAKVEDWSILNAFKDVMI